MTKYVATRDFHSWDKSGVKVYVERGMDPESVGVPKDKLQVLVDDGSLMVVASDAKPAPPAAQAKADQAK